MINIRVDQNNIEGYSQAEVSELTAVTIDNICMKNESETQVEAAKNIQIQAPQKERVIEIEFCTCTMLIMFLKQ